MCMCSAVSYAKQICSSCRVLYNLFMKIMTSTSVSSCDHDSRRRSSCSSHAKCTNKSIPRIPRALAHRKWADCFHVDPSLRPDARELLRRLDSDYDPDAEQKRKAEQRTMAWHDRHSPTLLLDRQRAQQEEWDVKKYGQAVCFKHHFLAAVQRFGSELAIHSCDDIYEECQALWNPKKEE